MNLLKAATNFIKSNLSCVATDAGKRAIVAWKPYQERLPTAAELSAQFKTDRAKGIAIICGAVSDNLECIDVDVKYDTTGTLFESLMAAIHESSAALSDKLMVVQTRSGGYHLYYRCDTIQGNQKLAQRPATAEEIKENPNEKVLVLIETRGEGGYVVAPPTEGYKKIGGSSIQRITPAEREVLMEICRSFNLYIIEQAKPATVRQDGFALTPWEDYNGRGADHMLTVLEKHGWQRNDRHSTKDKIRFKRPGKTDSLTSGDYHTGLNLFMVFTTSSVFEPLKGYKPSAVFSMLECNGDFKEAARQLALMGYGEKKQSFGGKLERDIFQKKQDGYSPEDLKKFVVERHKKNDTEADEIIKALDQQWGERICAFWDVNIDGENKKKIAINKTRFINFLKEVGGFGLYFYNTSSTIFKIIRVVDGLVEESSTEQMKKFVQHYIENLPDTFDFGTTPEVLMEMVIKSYASLFNEGFLEFLPHYNIDFLRDEKEKGYFAFHNGVVVVDKDKVTSVSYKDVNKVIWRNQIIDFQITIDQDFAPDSCEFYRFLEKISGDDEERLLYAMTLIGYTLHRYKNPSRPYAVILAEETENESEGGGTGKGILVKGVGHMVRTVAQDGKTFTPDKSFANQRVSLDTQLVAVEDCVKNLDFEKFNSQITEGMVVEKKNKDELYIEYKDSPKYLFTTNYTVKINGNHGKRRSKVFEFAPFFGPKNTPEDFFGHLLFTDWDQDEWNRFYNLMFFCLSMYLNAGIREVAASDKIKRKEIRLSFGDEFLEWFDHYCSNGCHEWKPFKEIYNGFMIENDFEKKDYTQKRFKKALESSGKLLEYRVETRRNWSKSGQHEISILKDGDEIHKNNEKPPDVHSN